MYTVDETCQIHSLLRSNYVQGDDDAEGFPDRNPLQLDQIEGDILARLFWIAEVALGPGRRRDGRVQADAFLARP